MYLFQYGQILFTQFHKSRFKVFAENFQFSITLWVILGRNNAVNATLLENIVHSQVLEFCSIV